MSKQNPSDLISYIYRLRFPNEDEKLFHDDYYKNSLIICRAAIILGTILYAIFGILDIWALPLSRNYAWFIRYVFVCPFFLGITVSTFSPFFNRWMQFLLSMTVLVAGFGIVAMIAISQKQEPAYIYYYAGLMLVTIWGFTFIRLRFFYASIVSFVIIIGYEIVALFFQNILNSPDGVFAFVNNNFFFVANIIVGMGACYFLELYNRRDFVQRRIIIFGQQQTEQLLHNILPEEIVKILKNKQQTIADHYDNTSVLFADLVGFTPLSEILSPKELVEMLNEIFSYFDSLVEKYGLEKIKTIGDCYMVAAGVPCPRYDHAVALVELAIEICDFATKYHFQNNRRLNFRIGIHSGSVIAGVIGLKKFSYDLWGDTVNTASRMESHGIAGKIQITDSTYELIKEKFVCESGGLLEIKGKGKMKVWHVIDRRVIL